MVYLLYLKFLYLQGYDKEQLTIRDRIIDAIFQKCKQHGAKHIETSQIVDRRNLEGKYFHDAKESEVICYLADDEQASERLALRIDLTVSNQWCVVNNPHKYTRCFVTHTYMHL